MIYLLLGEDLKSKDAKIAQIKSKFLTQPQALNFDFESIDGHGLSTDVLKKALVTLPVIAPKRLIVVRNVHKLKAADVLVLMQFLRTPADYADVILESSETTLKGDLKEAAALCTTTVFGNAPQGNVFDMTKLMAAGRGKEALNMLNNLYLEGTHPLQIMGGLVWFWGKEGRSLGKEKFEQGLKALEAADLNIKRSRLDPEYAVEKLIVELMELLGRR
jgi:DNA polymerase III delta subunit